MDRIDLDPSQILGVVITHLDGDHFNAPLVDTLGAIAPVYMHRAHARRASNLGLLKADPHVLADPNPLAAGLIVRPLLMPHDDLGVAAFRLEFPGAGVSLGYATDVGRVRPELARLLAGVDVLAIESNYCPAMQLASNRPAFLKRRIMGGSGHLSNQQCARLVARIAPRRHVVFLHLSSQCNRPELVSELHTDGRYGITIADQREPTPWILIGPPAPRGALPPDPSPLFAGAGLTGRNEPSGSVSGDG